MEKAKQVKVNKYIDSDNRLHEFEAEVISEVVKKEWGYDLEDRSSEKIRIKTEFRVRSKNRGKEINCVLWGVSAIKKGQKVRLWGKIRGSETSKCFVVYRFYIL